MREIKFRGQTKTVSGKEWIFGYCYRVKSFFNEEYQWFIRNDHILDSAIIEETLGQYTGLKDKNGKEIYEGDIVKVNFKEENIGKIIYEHNGFTIDVMNMKRAYGRVSFVNNFMEVIGNIYDNPDLLKESE